MELKRKIRKAAVIQGEVMPFIQELGIIKRKLLSEQYANIINVGKAKILNVVENKANIHYIRMNVLTKGAVIKTDKGTATITNRPAHEGFVCAKLIEK